MDLNYNLLKLEEIINNMCSNFLKQNNSRKLRVVLKSLIDGEYSDLIAPEYIGELNKYSKDSVRLVIEKNILLSIENKALATRKSYWEVLKDKVPRINEALLSHYYDDYINDLKKENSHYKSRTIDEINSFYDNEIKNSLTLFNNEMNAMLNSVSNVSLNHMENLNANGRVLSIDGKNRGGLFLDRNSKISYGKFVNKNEVITMLKILEEKEKSKIETKLGSIDIKDLKVIVGSINNCINISNNEKIKNQDARTISVGQTGIKKAGTIFFGKEGIDLPNGDYVSLEEINLAVNKFINESKEQPKKKVKVVSIKSKIKQFAAAAAVAVSVLSAALPGAKKNIINNVSNVVQEIENNDMKSSIESVVDNINFLSNNTIEEGHELVKTKTMDSVQTDLVSNEIATQNFEDLQNVNLLDNNLETKSDVQEVVEPIIEKQEKIQEQVVEPISEIMNPQEEVHEEIITPQIEEQISEKIELQKENQEIVASVDEPMKAKNDAQEEADPIEEKQEKIQEQVVEPISESMIPQIEEPTSEPIVPQEEIQQVVEPIVEEQSEQLIVPEIPIPEVAEQNIVAPASVDPVNIIPEGIGYIEGTNFAARSYNIYSPEQFIKLVSIVAGEDNGTYEGALAVVSVMCNRADKNGTDPLTEATSPSQFSAYGGDIYNKYMKGQIKYDYVEAAVMTALNGIRNTTATSFRGIGHSGAGRIEIGEPGRCNYYFNFLGQQVMLQPEVSGKTL